MTNAVSKVQRNPALDFTKGALVLFMVLYHWLEYFVSTTGDFYRYIRFVTPSFIFITGFLISNIYLCKYQITDSRLPRRLVQRGLKILGVFFALNVLISLIFSQSYSGRILFTSFSLNNLVAIYITGNTVIEGSGKAAAFYVLVPIGYLLLLSAGLLILGRVCKYVFQIAFFMFLGSTLVLSLLGLKSSNLELLTIGLLGVLFGYIPIEKINRFAGHFYAISAAYLLYLIAIRIWDVIYPLLIVGVCLTVALIYLVGSKQGQPEGARKYVYILGQYSLLGYISQIAVLQVLYRGLRHVNPGVGVQIISFFAAFALTIISVELVDRWRASSPAVDRSYRAIFA